MKSAKFPFLAANVKNAAGKNIAKPYIIKKYKGFKVAVFGLTTKTSEIVGNPENVKDHGSSSLKFSGAEIKEDQEL